jgi:hypothetical protein
LYLAVLVGAKPTQPKGITRVNVTSTRLPAPATTPEASLQCHVTAGRRQMNGWTVAKIVAAWKKFTARQICDGRRDSGEVPSAPVWHREYWDRYIRDQRHLQQAVEYIHLNPVKAGLVVTAESWRWSSAFPGANHERSRDQ